MKKFILGVFVGVLITAAGSAYAEDIVQTIIGKKVDGEFPIKIAGKQLDSKAAVVEGTSYLPVRAIGEAMGMDVKFDADLGIELTQKGVKSVENTAQPPVQSKSIQEQIDDLRLQINTQKENIEESKKYKQNFETMSETVGKDTVQAAIDKYTRSIAESEQKITDYEAQIAELEKQK